MGQTNEITWNYHMTGGIKIQLYQLFLEYLWLHGFWMVLTHSPLEKLDEWNVRWTIASMPLIVWSIGRNRWFPIAGSLGLVMSQQNPKRQPGRRSKMGNYLWPNGSDQTWPNMATIWLQYGYIATYVSEKDFESDAVAAPHHVCWFCYETIFEGLIWYYSLVL
jgi:hypothetical protein